MIESIDRRKVLYWFAGAGAATLVDSRSFLPLLPSPGAEGRLGGPADARRGMVVGNPEGALAGHRIIADGGNAVDGIVAAALTSGVVALNACGIGGYGGHMTIAMKGKPVRVIDFNSTAPAAARHDMFEVDADGRVPGRVNSVGWLAAGVPGTLAGMELAVRRYGDRSFREVLAPAIDLAREGFILGSGAVRSIRGSLQQFRGDRGSAELLLVDGAPPPAGSLFRNPDLAAMLETLAHDNSVEPFYRGSVARQIAEAFQANGGIVTAEDFAAHEARDLDPIAFEWMGETIYTAPLTAGGATSIEALSILRALDSTGGSLASSHARLECLRAAWFDRLKFFGDPEHGDVPVDRLLSDAYAERVAEKVATAIAARKPLDVTTQSRDQDGTIHLSAADPEGNMAALTLTHGGSFGAKVTVPGLGLILGHGVSRFDPNHGHPNSPGPGKRPLHNMCPTIVARDGRPHMALGGRGARRIPNAVFDVLVGVLQGKNLADSVAAPRMHTEGNMNLTLEAGWPENEVAAFGEMGYRVRSGRSASISAVAIDLETGALSSAER